MDIQAALERAQELNCQLKYDRVSVSEFEGQPGILVTRVPAACYHLHPRDDRFQQAAILVYVNDELSEDAFVEKVYTAIAQIEANFCEVYPDEPTQRLALIRKWGH